MKKCSNATKFLSSRERDPHKILPPVIVKPQTLIPSQSDHSLSKFNFDIQFKNNLDYLSNLCYFHSLDT